MSSTLTYLLIGLWSTTPVALSDGHATAAEVTSSPCPDPHIAVNDTCYVLGSFPNPLKWNDANEACLAKGWILANLKTPAQWEAVTTALQQHQWDRLYIGLSTHVKDLPGM